MHRCPLTPHQLEQLAGYGLPADARARCVGLTFAPGEAITLEGMPLEQLFVLLDGQAKVCLAAPNGRDLILCYYLSQGLIGELELMTDHAAATASVIALTDCLCAALPRALGAALLEREPALVARLAREVCFKLLRSSDGHARSALYSGEARLCAHLLQASPQGVFVGPLTELSATLGMSYRHLLRLLGQLCADGLLQKQGRRYRLTDPAALRRRADGA